MPHSSQWVVATGKPAFSEKQAAEILQRAAKLQEAAEDGSAYTPGVSLEELHKIAMEAGIDPKFLEVAMEAPESPEKRSWFSGLIQDYDRVLEGEIAPEDFDEVVQTLGPASRGGIRQIGRSLTGQVGAGFGLVRLDVTSKRGRTRIRAKAWPFVAFMTTMYPALIFSLVGGAIAGGRSTPAFGLAVAAGIIAFGASLFMPAAAASARSGKKLVDKVEDNIREILVNQTELPTSKSTEAQELEERLRASG